MYAAIKFFLFTLFGSALMIVSFLALSIAGLASQAAHFFAVEGYELIGERV